MKEKKERKEAINITIKPHLKEKLEIMAEEMDTSMSKIAARAIEETLRKAGRL